MLFFSFTIALHVSAKQCHPQGATVFLSESLQCQYGRRQVIGHTYNGTYIPTCYIAFIFLLRWLLHVSAKQCHPQGATMFLSEPLQCQYCRCQVLGQSYNGTYIPACYIAFIFLLRWLLHVSAKQCHPQGATMFL